jgi:cholesterol transport system auxiliary component
VLPLLVLLLAGCATRVLPPVSVYTLPADPGSLTAATADVGKQRKPALKLASIQGARPFLTTRMLYTEAGLAQNSFAYSRWSDSPVALLQFLLIEALNRSGMFQAVLPPGSSLRGNLVLEGTLLDFSLHTRGDQAEGVMKIRFLLLDQDERRVVASKLFYAAIPVEAPSPGNTAMALQQAAQQVAQQLVVWLDKHI